MTPWTVDTYGNGQIQGQANITIEKAMLKDYQGLPYRLEYNPSLEYKPRQPY